MILSVLSPTRIGLALALTSVAAAAYGVVRRVQSTRTKKATARKAQARVATRSATKPAAKSTAKKTTARKPKRAQAHARA